jgi:hypothetical protein
MSAQIDSGITKEDVMIAHQTDLNVMIATHVQNATLIIIYMKKNVMTNVKLDM